MDSCIEESGGCYPWQGQEGFWTLSWGIYSRRRHQRADGATQRVMVVACNLGTSDKCLAAGQPASFPHTCSENYYRAPPGTAPREGRKGDGKVHIDEGGSSWVWKVQTQTGEQESLWLVKVVLCMYIKVCICMPVYAVYFAFLETSENYFLLPARNLHPVIILNNCN